MALNTVSKTVGSLTQSGDRYLNYPPYGLLTGQASRARLESGECHESVHGDRDLSNPPL